MTQPVLPLQSPSPHLRCCRMCNRGARPRAPGKGQRERPHHPRGPSASFPRQVRREGKKVGEGRHPACSYPVGTTQTHPRAPDTTSWGPREVRSLQGQPRPGCRAHLSGDPAEAGPSLWSITQAAKEHRGTQVPRAGYRVGPDSQGASTRANPFQRRSPSGTDAPPAPHLWWETCSWG